MNSSPVCQELDCKINPTLLVVKVSNRRVSEEKMYCEQHGVAITGLAGPVAAKNHHTDIGENEPTRFDIRLLVFNHATTVCRVILSKPDGDIRFGVDVGYFEGTCLYNALKLTVQSRPLTHMVMLDIVKALNGKVQEVVIADYVAQGNFYRADLLIDTGEERLAIDCRPSDAFCVAVYSGVDILVARNALDR